MKLNKLVLKFVSISFSILVMLLVVIGLIKLGSFCYDFGYRVFTEGPVEEKPGTDVTVDVTGDLSEYQIGKLLKKEVAGSHGLTGSISKSLWVLPLAKP